MGVYGYSSMLVTYEVPRSVFTYAELRMYWSESRLRVGGVCGVRCVACVVCMACVVCNVCGVYNVCVVCGICDVCSL